MWLDTSFLRYFRLCVDHPKTKLIYYIHIQSKISYFREFLYYNGKKIRKTENSAIQGAKESGRQLKIPRAEAECAPSEQFVQGRGVNAPASARVKGAKGYGVAVPKQSGTAVVRLCILCIL